VEQYVLSPQARRDLAALPNSVRDRTLYSLEHHLADGESDDPEIRPLYGSEQDWSLRVPDDDDVEFTFDDLDEDELGLEETYVIYRRLTLAEQQRNRALYLIHAILNARDYEDLLLN
jgi:hypothetical protein